MAAGAYGHAFRTHVRMRLHYFCYIQMHVPAYVCLYICMHAFALNATRKYPYWPIDQRLLEDIFFLLIAGVLTIACFELIQILRG